MAYQHCEIVNPNVPNLVNGINWRKIVQSEEMKEISNLPDALTDTDLKFSVRKKIIANLSVEYENAQE